MNNGLLMNKEKEIQAVQLQKQTLMKNILVGSIIVLILFAFLFTRNINLNAGQNTGKEN